MKVAVLATVKCIIWGIRYIEGVVQLSLLPHF